MDMVQIDLGMSIIKRTKLILISKPIWRNMKVIPLKSRKYPGHEAIVDDEDYEILISHNWRPVINKRVTTIYATTNIEGIKIDMHRFVMKMHGHDIEHKLIDHEDHNGLNNQRENLRVCNHSQNAQNSKKPITGKTSIYKGVCYHKGIQKYTARIKLNSKHTNIGVFDNEIDAALAYNQKAIEMFGKFAKLNVI
jgi:hypothetical protein